MDSWVRDLVSVQCFLSLPPPTFPSLLADWDLCAAYHS